MYLSLKFLASILIKVIEEFCIVWLNSSLFFSDWTSDGKTPAFHSGNSHHVTQCTNEIDSNILHKISISGLMAEIQLLGLFPFFLISLQSAMKQASRMLNDEFERFFFTLGIFLMEGRIFRRCWIIQTRVLFIKSIKWSLPQQKFILGFRMY